MLLLDVGNTRIKYRVDGGPVTAVAHGGDVVSALARVTDGAEQIAAVDVTGVVSRALAGRPAQVLVASAECCGVVNAYASPERLGADRWAALIGARTVTSRGCCVIDVGSAITADVMAADGRHLGGWIAPGISLATRALADGTRSAHANTQGRPGAAPATNTDDAILRGVEFALVGFAVRARDAAAAALGEDPVVLVCGGDAMAVAAAVGGDLVDDLVLRGLAAWVARR